MGSNQTQLSPTEYLSARSRTSSIESSSRRTENRAVFLAPLPDDGRGSIGVSSNRKRQYKDRRIYLNLRTGLPVRPPTSFGLFKHALRRNMQGDKVDFFDFHKKAIEEWNKMKDEEKAPYLQRSKELAEQFKKIEAQFLRKKVRQLQSQVKEYRANNYRRRWIGMVLFFGHDSD